MKRIFEILMEVDENQVTLSPALVRHMIRHNRHGRKSLRILPVKGSMNGRDLIGLDVNPPYMNADATYQNTLSEVQYDPKTKLTGYQMEDPTVLSVLMQYGEIEQCAVVEKIVARRYVEAQKMCGRWIYWILPEQADENRSKLERLKLWTAWMIKWNII